MQSIGKILEMNQAKIYSGTPRNQSVSNSATSSPSKHADSQAKRIEVLFSRFAAFYGHVWRSQFKNDGFLKFAKKEWLDALSGFSDTVMNKAILECRDSYELPPTLPQLIQCCRQIRKRHDFYLVKKDYVPAKKEVVIAHLKQCKAFLTK